LLLASSRLSDTLTPKAEPLTDWAGRASAGLALLGLPARPPPPGLAWVSLLSNSSHSKKQVETHHRLLATITLTIAIAPRSTHTTTT
jgi:hypothetical protein